MLFVTPPHFKLQTSFFFIDDFAPLLGVISLQWLSCCRFIILPGLSECINGQSSWSRSQRSWESLSRVYLPNLCFMRSFSCILNGCASSGLPKYSCDHLYFLQIRQCLLYVWSNALSVSHTGKVTYRLSQCPQESLSGSVLT